MPVCAERPKLKAHIPAMQETLARVMGIDTDDVSIKATTTEKGFRIGREEGISAYVTVLITDWIIGFSLSKYLGFVR